MPTAIGGTDTFPATFNIPSGGDLRNASGVNPALEALANRTQYLLNRAVIDEVFDENTGSSVLAEDGSGAYGGLGGPSTLDLTALTTLQAGDVVEINGFVHVDGASTTNIRLRPAVRFQIPPSTETDVVGAEISPNQVADLTAVPVFAQITAPAGAVSGTPMIQLKTGNAPTAARLYAPFAVASRVKRRP